MIKKIDRALFIAFLILVIWALLAQFVLFKNRLSDETAKNLFSQKDVALKIADTTINNRKIHYAISGVDTFPTLIFIHGSPGSWSNYRKFMWDKQLLSKYRMVSIDRPGFGHSDFGKALHVPDQANLLVPILKTINNGKPVILCGHSMGVPVAIQIAIDAPELVNKLVLVGAPIDVALEKKEIWRYFMDKKPFYYLLPGAFGPSNTELLYLKTDLISLQQQYYKIICEVEFIHGDKDDWVPIENVAYGLKTMINAQKIKVDTLHGSGHLIPWKDQEKFKELLLNAAIE